MSIKKNLLKLLTFMIFLFFFLVALPKITQAQTSEGFTFLEDGYTQEYAVIPKPPYVGPVVPSSVIHYSNGDYLVTRYEGAGFIYRFNPNGRKEASPVTSLGSFNTWTWGFTWGLDGHIYATNPGGDFPGFIYELDIETGGIVRTVASGLDSPKDITVDPLNGDLIVVESRSNKISRVNPNTGVISLLSADPLLIDPVGILFSDDGEILYVANGNANNILELDRSGVAQEFVPLGGPPAGLVFGEQNTPLANHLLVNRGDGQVDKVNLPTKSISVFASGGEGGRLASVDAQGSLYFTQRNSVIKVTPGYGSPSPGMIQVPQESTIKTNTNWSLSQSPILVSEDVVVAPGVTLTIEPGVVIQFEERASLEIYGILAAVGTEGNPIIFTSATSAPNPGDWAFIRLHPGAGDSQLSYITIEFAGNPARNADGALVIMDGVQSTISNSIIQHNNASGISIYGGPVTITDSTIRHNLSGVFRNRFDPYLSLGGGIRVIKGTLSIQNSSIINNIAGNLPGDPITGGAGLAGGIAVQDGWVTILNSTIANNQSNLLGGGIGAHTYSAGQLIVKDSVIRENKIEGCIRPDYHCYGGGIAMRGVSGELVGNLIESNTIIGGEGGGIYVAEAFYPIVNIQNNVIMNNNADYSAGGRFYTRYVFEGNLVQGNQATSPGGVAGIKIRGSIFTTQIRCNSVVFNIASNEDSPGGVSFHRAQIINENNIYGNVGYGLTMYNFSGSYLVDSDVTNNWWGTLDTSDIATIIYDNADDPTLAQVNFEPFAVERPSCAPPLDGERPTATVVPLNPVKVGEALTLSVTIDDSISGNTRIIAAEYYVGEDPGLALGTRMTPADGMLDSSIESFTATIDSFQYGVGVFQLTVRGVDHTGNWTLPETISLVIFGPPTANAGQDLIGNEGSSLTFDGSNSTDPDGVEDIVGYAWDFGDGTVGVGPVVTHVYDDNGEYTATLTVTDSFGESDADTINATVNNIAPTAYFTSSSETILEGESLVLTFSGQFDPGANDTAVGFLYSYDCTDDGTFEISESSVTTFTCDYPDSGTFNTRGRIKDKDGDFNDYLVVITVLTPSEAVQDIVDTVEDFNLQQGIDSSLDVKLEAAVQALDDINENNDVAAINSLEAFINAVEAQRGKKITNEQADVLVEAAQAIIDNLTNSQ